MPTNRFLQRCSAGMAVVLAGLLLAPGAGAHKKGSSTSARERPEIASVHCGSSAAEAGCREGRPVALRGERLARVTRVVFLGARGRQDDRHVHPRRRSLHRVVLRVPVGARSGRLRAVSRGGRASRGGPRLVVASSEPASPAEPAPGDPDGVFPVRGRYDFGTATNGFGGGRGHQGQDIFARCGTSVLAARDGRVVTARRGGNEGNYAVTQAPDGTQQAYLHMLQPASVRRGDRVAAGQPIGRVGESGNASGCHLHFELWTAPGRFAGGEAFDPRPDLEAWAAAG